MFLQRSFKSRGLSHHGFTLIELLIVVAIIAILAAIAVPNFLEAQTRAKTARVKADMRSEATALETYHIDYNAFPPAWEYWPAGPGRTWGTFSEIPGGPFHSRMPSYLTTPVAYITSLPSDPFRKNKTSNNLKEVSLRQVYFNIPYYYAGGVSKTSQNNITVAQKLAGDWFFYSVGPDINEFNTPAGASLSGRRVFRDYDPTNGTLSLGNIFRSQKNGELLGVDPYFWSTP